MNFCITVYSALVGNYKINNEIQLCLNVIRNSTSTINRFRHCYFSEINFFKLIVLWLILTI